MDLNRENNCIRVSDRWREHRMNNRWFYRMLFSYLPIFFVLTSFLVLFSFMSIRWSSQKEAERSNELFTRQVMELIDNSLNSIDQKILNEIMNNATFQKFFDKTKEENKYMDFLIINDNIKNIIHTTPLISDLYLFRYEDDTILTRDMRIGLDQFYDGGFIHNLQGQSLNYSWTDVRQVQETNIITGETVSKTVISLIRKVPILRGEQGLIVVNINTRNLQRFMNELLKSDVNVMALYDRQGKPITDLSEHNTKSFSPSTRLSSEYTGWMMESAIKKDPWFMFSNAVSIVWLIIWVLVLVIGLVWIINVTRNNYAPIETLLKRLHLYHNGKQLKWLGTGVKDEFDIIGSALDHLIEQSEHANKEVEENRILKQRRYFLNLLEGIGGEEGLELLQGDSVKLLRQPVSIQAAVIEIDRFHEFVQHYSMRDQFLLKFVLQNVLSEISANHGVHVWSDWKTGSHLAALFFVNGSAAGMDIHTLCREVHEWVNAHLQYTVTIGVGGEVRVHTDIHHSYEEAVIALRSKFSKGGDQIFHYQDTQERSRNDMLEPLAVIQSLARAFARMDDQWKKDFELLFESIRNGELQKGEIISLMRLTLFTIDQEMKQYSEQYKELWGKEAMEPLQQSLESEDTLEGIAQYYRTVLGAIHSKLKELRENRGNKEWIQQIRDYIDVHYGNPDLSLVLLSDRFQMNGSYLSRIFKEEIGVKLNEYIVDVRIHAAKRLIVHTQDAIQDIAVQVGYQHAMSFIRVFKKVVGLTPGDYRKNNLL